MREPEADGRCRNHLSPAPFDFQEGLPIVVRNRKARGIGVLAGRAVEVIDRLASSHLSIGGAGDHIHHVAVGRHEVALGLFQRAPDSLVEVLVDLGRLVRRVVGLAVHLGIRLACRIGALVPAGVGVVPIHRPITVLGDAHLFVLVDVRVELPTARAGAARLEGLGQMVSGPQARVVGIAVVVAVVPVRFRGSAAAVEGAHEVFVALQARQFQPGAMDPLALCAGRERFDLADDLDMSAVPVAYRHEGLVVVGRGRGEALDDGRELAIGGIRQVVGVDGLLCQ